MTAKTGSHWERQDDDDDREGDLPSANTKVFLNRHINKDLRLTGTLRKASRKIVEKDDAGAENKGQTEDAEDKVTETKKTEKIVIKEEQTQCSKEEYAVAKHLRFNTAVHEGKLAGMTVKCFIASDAVNCLMDSKWAKGKGGGGDSEVVFTDRRSVALFLNKLLGKGIFHRADKVEKKKDKDKRKKKKEEEVSAEDKKSKKDKKKTEKVEKTEETDKKKEEKKEEDKKPKTRKFKLNMGEDQRFVDGSSVYVWIYDPIHPKTFTIGLLMLIGAAALCLFPLWPDWMRIGVYYVSLLGASFVGFMLFLIVVRVIVFSCVWLLTLGKHHLWIFPNLTEDVGVLDSFRPLIKHDVYKATEETENTDKKKKSKKAEEENETEPQNGFEMVETADVEDKNSEQGEEDRDIDDDEENSENEDISESQEEK